MNVPLYLYRAVLADPLAVHRFARELRLPDHPLDIGYVLHCLLKELFGPDIPMPFVQDPRRRGLAILAYSRVDEEALLERARSFAPPEVFRLFNWRETAAKPLPNRWRSNAHLGFRVRACPLVRGPTGHGRDKRIETHRECLEVDAFLARLWRSGPEGITREGVYREWLSRELSRQGAARLERATLRGFRLIRCLRRDRKRTTHTVVRPDALFEGVLQVQDEDAFSNLLGRGLGRHRAFGFGMLLLRPAEGL